MMDVYISGEREPLFPASCYERMVDAQFTLTAPAPFADPPLTVIAEPSSGACVIDGLNVTFTAPGFYQIRITRTFGLPHELNRTLEFVAWEQAALDWLIKHRAKQATGNPIPRTPTELRERVLRSLSREYRDRCTGLVSDMQGGLPIHLHGAAG